MPFTIYHQTDSTFKINPLVNGSNVAFRYIEIYCILCRIHLSLNSKAAWKIFITLHYLLGNAPLDRVIRNGNVPGQICCNYISFPFRFLLLVLVLALILHPAHTDTCGFRKSVHTRHEMVFFFAHTRP